MKDTFIRSCEHWSEKSRNEMQNFYVLASIDYKHLAENLNGRNGLRFIKLMLVNVDLNS